MLFQDSKDESAIGLALTGFGIVVMAIILGNITGNVQPKGPFEEGHTDVSAPYLREQLPAEHPHPDQSSPYAQPETQPKR